MACEWYFAEKLPLAIWMDTEKERWITNKAASRRLYPYSQNTELIWSYFETRPQYRFID